jgi:hypothetical protein
MSAKKWNADTPGRFAQSPKISTSSGASELWGKEAKESAVAACAADRILATSILGSALNPVSRVAKLVAEVGAAKVKEMRENERKKKKEGLMVNNLRY